MWIETGTAPDQQTGGTWHYYRLGGNNFGFVANREYSATMTYNKTVLILQNGQTVNNETHVSAHVVLTDKADNSTQNIGVRYYYVGQNVMQGEIALPAGTVRDSVVGSLQTISGY